MRNLHSVFLFTCLTALTSYAGTVYTTFGPGDTFGGTGASIIGGPSPYAAGAMAFTPAVSTTVIDVKVALNGIGTVDFGIVAGVLTPPTGVPSSIGSFAVNGVGVYTASINVPLTGGTQYWLVLFANQGAYSGGAWFNGPSATGPRSALATSPAGSWSQNSGVQSAFTISDAVPEPSTNALIAIGAAAFGYLRLRGRRYTK